MPYNQISTNSNNTDPKEAAGSVDFFYWAKNKTLKFFDGQRGKRFSVYLFEPAD
jgi:hypothetical protein